MRAPTSANTLLNWLTENIRLTTLLSILNHLNYRAVEVVDVYQVDGANKCILKEHEPTQHWI